MYFGKNVFHRGTLEKKNMFRAMICRICALSVLLQICLIIAVRGAFWTYWEILVKMFLAISENTVASTVESTAYLYMP